MGHLSSDYAEERGWGPTFNAIDAAAAADSRCSACQHEGLKYEGVRRGHVYVAISVCPACGHSEDF